MNASVTLHSRPLAAGAAGTVFQGKLSDGAEVVVKLNRIGAEKPKLVNGVQMVVCNKNAEIEALRRLKDVDSVARLLGTVCLTDLTFEDGKNTVDVAKFESPGLVLELVHGVTLKKYLMSEQYWSSLFATNEAGVMMEYNALMIQSLLSAAEQNDRGVIHIDWHFHNLMVDYKSTVAFSQGSYYGVKTIDYGLVKFDVSVDHGVQYFARKLHKVDQLASDLNYLPILVHSEKLGRCGFRFSENFHELLKLKFPAGHGKADFFALMKEAASFLDHMAEEFAQKMDSSLFARRRLCEILVNDAEKVLGSGLAEAKWTLCFLGAVKRALLHAGKTKFPQAAVGC
jgi:hypothetical protein